ncbi:MscS Mechanosensitive ion channel [Methanocaldococcus vulcanius M7]|uniref:MscS Mechanosensitive ion channel n=1 Tax=Methanocaldococcus vulcanius (strain ATCC 700851 / DSM 12094 / M7) TaxID=579137 RepID=C9REV7_METVM|nr:mechanosensitive ion channel family protein [Methanocaldococcus vulcanius]ACX72109.1 MscS Mechanosensitive ion channel [Methanocaldococcus vulcanius M7]
MLSNITIYGNSITNYILCISTIILSVILAKIISRIMKNQLTSKNDTKINDIFFSLNDPLLVSIVIIGIYFGVKFLSLPEQISDLIHKAIGVALTLCGVVFVERFIDKSIERYLIPFAERKKRKIDDQLVNSIRKFARGVVYTFAILFILRNLGYDITTLLAGLGIGGLAVALAMQDTTKNLIAGLIIIFDKPFRLKDWIVFDGGEGIVEEIGIRSTRIRTWEDSLIIMPNSSLVDAKITNMSAMRKRRVLMTIGLTYDTSAEKVRRAIEIIENILNNHEAVIEPKRVHFVEYGDWSLNLRVEYFIKNLGFDYYLNTLTEINLKIKEEFEKEGIEMAFPTYTVYLEKDS